jgi:hypothetical protein
LIGSSVCPGAVIDGVSFVDCVFRGGLAEEVVLNQKEKFNLRAFHDYLWEEGECADCIATLGVSGVG